MGMQKTKAYAYPIPTHVPYTGFIGGEISFEAGLEDLCPDDIGLFLWKRP